MSQNPKPKIQIICAQCGSDDVTRDAFARWDVEGQEWVLSDVLDAGNCDNCEESDVKLKEVPIEGAEGE